MVFLTICLATRELPKKSFEIALKYNPRTSVSKKEVLNPKVVTFFNKVKKQSRKSKKRPSAKRDNPYKKETNRTVILLKTPAKGTVLIDGIYAGTTGKPLEVSPGILKVSIQAKGYKSKSIKLKVRKNRTNSYAIKMTKIQPKRKAKPVAKKKKKRKQYPKISKDDMFAEAPESAPVIQGRDLKQELAVEGGGGYASSASTSCPTLLSAASTLLSTATAILSAGTSATVLSTTTVCTHTGSSTIF